MVLKHQLHSWTRHQALALLALSLSLSLSLSLTIVVLATAISHPACAEEQSAESLLHDSYALYHSGQYFKAARYAFSASEKKPALKSEGYSWVTISLVHARLFNSASYFFIRTLQSGNKTAIQRVLSETQNLLVHVGADLLRKYLVRYTVYEDYDPVNRSAYLFSLGKDALLHGQSEKAIGYLNGIHGGSPLWPYALQLRGSAQAILGHADAAIEDFKSCVDRADGLADYLDSLGRDDARVKGAHREAQDLKARCTADEARTFYQADRFDEADQTYDLIRKSSIVWPEILFEQAWTAFAKDEYNRTLGKLVSYKSPALSFVFNTEIDVLRAQSYLALCLYDDANNVINEFNGKYSRTGEAVKEFVESNSSNLGRFYELGKEALHSSLYSSGTHQVVNQFVRGPYFQNLINDERQLIHEQNTIGAFDATQTGVSHDTTRGFPGFLNQILGWRSRTIHLLGGMFVKNSLMDYHSALIADFEKMAFIKLEMLKRAKEQLIYKHPPSYGRSRGNVIPTRKDYQYYWTFNGEFWNDELGDYVFGLESECNKS